MPIKQIFFANILPAETPKSTLYFFHALYYGDGYIPLPGRIVWLEKAVLMIQCFPEVY